MSGWPHAGPHVANAPAAPSHPHVTARALPDGRVTVGVGSGPTSTSDGDGADSDDADAPPAEAHVAPVTAPSHPLLEALPDSLDDAIADAGPAGEDTVGGTAEAGSPVEKEVGSIPNPRNAGRDLNL
jgi:hypothetical protein